MRARLLALPELGTILLRNFAFGASTPWKRIRCKRGRGTRAARRSMNSSGAMTIWVVPSLNATLQLQHDLAGAVTLEPFVGDGRAGDIAAQVLQFLALIGAPAHRRMEAKAVEFGAQVRRGWFVWARHALQAQHLLPRSWPERDAVGAGGRLQGQKRAFPIRFGEVGPVLLCGTARDRKKVSWPALGPALFSGPALPTP